MNEKNLEAQLDQINDTDTILHELFGQYATLKTEKGNLEAQLDQIDEQMNPIKNKIISLMVEMEYQKVSYNGILYYLSVPGRPSIISEKRNDFLNWLRDAGEDGIIQPDYINSNTLWEWYKNQSDEIKEQLTSLGMLKVSTEIQLKSPKEYRRKRKKR